MPGTEQQDKTLSEVVVKEAVGKGMDSPLRESILEAVEEADGSPSGGKRRLPLAGMLFGAGAALGFLAGRQSTDLEETPLEDIDQPEIIDDVADETTTPAETADSETETDADDESDSSRLGRLLLAVGVLAGIALLRRRFGASDDDDEWEPIEEFEPATDLDEDDAEPDVETAGAEADVGESDDTDEE
ncbi:hypothetical protein [Natronorubrum sulfidifaciens]|uniref:MYXO-CTERM domain-containing protein n=1 Tax=Natronorubrum sulfidifaciens JCM 14089 TaxID=1230460 RepID=L9VY07_9EURY|nr:hypothetical protein [Natronorubrum sulfidifaciens]ELY42044.1 hypothetical protein C495_15878 [Natronorubrum sulfidifaciens JCM 14089]